MRKPMDTQSLHRAETAHKNTDRHHKSPTVSVFLKLFGGYAVMSDQKKTK